MSELDELRLKINEVDEKILSLLGKRLKLVSLVGRYKKTHNLPVVDKNREKEILERLGEKGQTHKLKPDFVKKIWKLLFKEAYTQES